MPAFVPGTSVRAPLGATLAAWCMVLNLLSAVFGCNTTAQPHVRQMAKSGLFFGNLALLKIPMEMSERPEQSLQKVL